MSYTADQQARSHHVVPLNKLTVMQYGFSVGKDVRTMDYCHDNYTAFVDGMQEDLAEGNELLPAEESIGFLNTILEAGLEVKKNLLFDKEILPVMQSIYREDHDQIGLSTQFTEIERGLVHIYLIEMGVRQEIARLAN
jgi:hypothetical protein